MSLPVFHVLTGGPGSGKSSLIAALAQAGLQTAEEAGRAIIRDQHRQGFSEAERSCAAMCEVYHELGYRLIEVPRMSLPRRLDFILQHSGLKPAPACGSVPA